MMTQSNLTFTENHEIPEGYKKTEVGFIPENWNVVPLMHISEKIMVGIASSATHAYRNKGIPLLRNQNIKSNKLDDDDIIYISEDYEKGFFNKRLKEGDLLTARTGYPGTTCLVPKIFENAQSFTTLITRLKSDSENPIYLSYFINSEKGQKFFTDNQIGGGQKNVNAATLKRFPVIIPPLNEQQKIATALSDTDALISELEKLIEKKKGIKTATMQQLLTGKTRLPEFALREDGTPKGYKDSELGQIAEDWNIIRISEIALVQRGASPRPIDSPIWFDKNSDIGWLRISDLTKSFKYLVETSQNLSKLGVLNSRYVPKNQLVMSICATVGKPIITKKDLCIHDGFVVFNNLKSEMDYLYYVLEDLEKSWSKKGQTGSQMNLNSELINQTIIRMPPSQDEQRSIATIISDMDQELKALYRKLNKANYVRQGMMQELLTGKTRLV